MERNTKRKFEVKTFKILKRLDNGALLKKLSAEYSVGEVTVGDWIGARKMMKSTKQNKQTEYEKLVELFICCLPTIPKRKHHIRTNPSRKGNIKKKKNCKKVMTILQV